MKDLRVGDFVMGANEKFQKVYSFGHRDEAKTSMFLILSPSNLELSEGHMVFVRGKGAIPASMARVGDTLSDGQPIASIQQVVRTGVYAPYTESGTIIVNGVLASNYISFQGSDVFKLGSIKTPFTYQWLDHAFQTPHRIWCVWLGMKDGGQTENGFSVWSELPFKFSGWFLNQSPIVMGVLMVPALLVFGFVAGAEFVLFQHPTLGCAVLFAMFTMLMIRTRSTKMVSE